MLYNNNNEYDRAKFILAAQEASMDGVWELKRRRPGRSLKQNRYLHLILGYFAAKFGYTLDEVKVDYFKRRVNPHIFVVTRVDDLGERKVLRSSARLTTDEMTLAIERFRNWSASECGLYLPAPGETEMLLYVEQQVETHKEYL